MSEGECVRLDLNESPLPPPREVIEAAAREVERANRYPEPSRLRLLESLLADYAGVPEGYVAVFNGGDEALRVIIERLGGEGVAAPRYSFTMYKYLSRALGSALEELEMEDDGEWWRLREPLEPRSRLVIIDSPNNPTGSPLLSEDLAVSMLEKGHTLVVDEAYYEFYGKSLAGLTEAYDNIIVLRTMSKAFALAGLRVGYLIARPSTLERLAAKALPFPISRPSLEAAIKALELRSYASEIVRYVEAMKPRYRAALEKAGFKVYGSKTNFLLTRAPSTDALKKLDDRCVRVRRTELGPEWVRVTVGGEKELKALINALSD